MIGEGNAVTEQNPHKITLIQFNPFFSLFILPTIIRSQVRQVQ